MRRLLFAGGVGLVMLGLSVQPAPAITGGQVDENNTYSNVGALVVTPPLDIYPPWVLASGTLIHPRVVLTAGHVTREVEKHWGDAANLFQVSFGTDALEPSTWHEVEAVITHPGYHMNGDPAGGPADANDVGVVILKKPVRRLPLAVLPEPFLLDQLKAAGLLREPPGATKFTVAGYGSLLDHPPPQILEADGLRRVALSEYLALRDDWLVVSQNFATGDGGTGFGDSGGPTFWTAPDGTQVLVSITSRGDPKLVSMGFTQRIDIPESLSFIEFVLSLMD